MGGFGTRAGAGETQIEVDRRIIRKKISLLKKKLKSIDSERRVQSKKRKSFFRASFVGYTNVGKSSLMKSVTKSDVLIRNQLFATLDTTVRRLYIGNNNHILLSDTVGFIRNLPDNLIASFKSTLQEVVDSDLLLIVLDANSKDLFNEIETIKSVLKEIHADQIDYQYVFNKIDLVDQDKISYLKQTFPDSIMVSATRSLQISDIKDIITKKYKEWISALKNPSH
jgi:GTP-binding protein HflX